MTAEAAGIAASLHEVMEQFADCSAIGSKGTSSSAPESRAILADQKQREAQTSQK
jgi:hypothetical protein